MSIWQKTKSRYDRKDKIDWNVDYAMGLCKQCASFVLYKADGGEYCAKCGDTEAVKVLQSQITEYREQFSEQLRIRDEMVSAIRPTLNAIKQALIGAGDGEIAHPVEEATKIERASDVLIVNSFKRIVNPYLVGSVRVGESPNEQPEYKEAHQVSDNFNFDDVKEIPF